MDGVRLVTDPVVTARAAHLTRMADPVPTGEGCDAVLISHLHMDHLHLGSLRRLRPPHVVGPPGIAAVLRGSGIGRVSEVRPDDRLALGGLTVTALPADHDGRRMPWSAEALSLGFMISGSRNVYFAGDTGPFDGMSTMAREPIDAALLPIWGWGPSLGRGRHLDPLTAAEALALLRPRWAVPIHWGTYAPMWVSRRHPPAFLTQPAHDFARHASRLAPGVKVETLRPGGPGLTLS